MQKSALCGPFQPASGQSAFDLALLREVGQGAACRAQIVFHVANAAGPGQHATDRRLRQNPLQSQLCPAAALQRQSHLGQRRQRMRVDPRDEEGVGARLRRGDLAVGARAQRRPRLTDLWSFVGAGFMDRVAAWFG